MSEVRIYNNCVLNKKYNLIKIVHTFIQLQIGIWILLTSIIQQQQILILVDEIGYMKRTMLFGSAKD